MIEKLGGDLVGMSTVFEAIASHHTGINVAGISCITNMAAGILEEKLRHDDIKEKADQAFDTFSKLIKTFIAKL
jgi:purine-nucleoside phosphorylase